MIFHIPVMLEEVLENLITKKGGVYLDCTIGGGGHSQKIIEHIYPSGWLIGFDQDIEALEFTREKLASYQDKVILVKTNFSDLEIVLPILGFTEVSGIFFDLGISSHQVDTSIRGFSFNKDNFLDMRMDLSKKFDARYIVNHYSEKQLAEIFSRYGQERYSRSLARLIVEERKKNALETTNQLAQLIIKFYAKHKKGKWRIHPATRVFQAIRIEVNKELWVLEQTLCQAIKILEPKGRIGVISYHSLEDRVVKNTFREWEKREVFTQFGYGLRRLYKKPICPKDEEIRQNPRARSAKLRFAEKVCVKEVSEK